MLEKSGDAVLVTHSQGGGIGWLAGMLSNRILGQGRSFLTMKTEARRKRCIGRETRGREKKIWSMKEKRRFGVGCRNDHPHPAVLGQRLFEFGERTLERERVEWINERVDNADRENRPRIRSLFSGRLDRCAGDGQHAA